MLRTLLKNLKGSDWEMLTDFVSPVFFDVVPTVAMARIFGKIVKDFANKSEFTNIKTENATVFKGLNSTALRSNLKMLDSTLQKPETFGASIKSLSVEERKARGNLVLQIYFAQIFHCRRTILDLRSLSFGEDSSWDPRPIFYQWDPEFKDGICALYQGFYEENPTQFAEGLRQLSLSHAETTFKAHFGEGTQDQVIFNLSHFKKSFHSIFVSCKENRTKLHPDFFALGVYLVCLYEHLEKLEVPLNVRKAFHEVRSA